MRKNFIAFPSMKNILLAVVLFLFLFFFIRETLTIEYPSNVFPLALQIVIAIFTVIILVTPEKGEQSNQAQKVKWFRVIGIILGSVLYLIVMPLIGFYVTSFIFITFVSWILGKTRTLKDFAICSLASFSIVVFIFLIFYVGVNIPTPPGLLI